MKNQTSCKIKAVSGAEMAFFLITVLLFGSVIQPTQAGTIAQAPLFISQAGVNPNIMLVLDDSGSMMFEIMPEGYTYSFSGCSSMTGSSNQGAVYMFPRANTVYGSSDYYNVVPNVPSGTNTNPYGAMMRSSAWNKMYYDPAITYTPWKKYDNTLYPNASTTCALHNPERSGTGAAYCRDLTANLANSASTIGTCWGSCNAGSESGCTSGSSGTSTAPTSFPAATYYYYNPNATGTNPQWTLSNYTKQSIVPGTTTYTGHGRINRKDCTSLTTCTYAQEIQNFANWYTYYRSRVLAVRGGVGKAFADQREDLRVGFGTINQGSSTIDGITSSSTIITGVRPFTGSARQAVYTNLYTRNVPAQGTPLRQALDAAGQYFSRADDKGPWADVPGSASGFKSCRRSYTILMTDGYWNGNGASTSGATVNVDKTAGPTITGPDGQTYTYSPASPFKDDWSATLADIAMYYWNRDLHSTLANRVPTSTIDPAFWQHMVTFGVGLGVNGTISPTTAFNAISTGATVNWPQPSTTGTTQNIDDLLHAAVNSRGNFFSAADPDSFATQLSGLLQEIVARETSSASALATTSTKLDTNTMSYQAKFDSNDWSGQLAGYLLDPVLGTLGAEPQWNTDTAGKIPAPSLDSGTATSTSSGRKIYTIVGSTGKEFLWANLDTGQKTALKTLNSVVDTDAVALKRLNWIRGYQSDEKPSGTLRKRTKLLGDIVNSDPFYVGKPIVNPNQLEQTGYAAFIAANESRTGMLYVGANDGMLHAFNAQTGVEQFAYIPKAVFSSLSSLPDPTYNHKYFVDGSPIVSDAQIGGAWKSILIGTTGAGGRSVFALDVTNPGSFDASKVLWEFTDPDLGYTIGRPTIGQLKDGTWVAVFGNGYNSDNGKAFMFVVNLANGALLARTSTMVGDTTTPNGLAEPAVLPDTDGKIIAAYAGDLRGNLWKYDLTTRTFAFSRTPLFTAQNVSNIAQPITSAPAISKYSDPNHPDRGGYLIFFGTGKYFETGDHSTDIPKQSLYGVWDKATFVNGAWQGGTVITARSILQPQTVIGESLEAGNNWRMVSKNPISWETQRGWYLELPTAGEQITDSPTLNAGRVLFITRIPRRDPDPCVLSAGTSWFMAVDMMTGGRSDKNVFDVDRDSKSSEFDYITVNGEKGVASGFETIVAGMSQVTLMRSSKGIQVLLSGTGELSTTASSVSESAGTVAKNLLALVKAAVTATATSAAYAQAALDAQAAALAAQAAADAAPNDPALAQAARDAASKKADADAALIAANTTERQAIINAAQAIIDAAQAIINAGGVGKITKAEAEAIKNEAIAIRNQASAIPLGQLVPPGLSGKLPPLAARLQGQGNVGTSIIIQTSRESWQQLQ